MDAKVARQVDATACAKEVMNSNRNGMRVSKDQRQKLAEKLMTFNDNETTWMEHMGQKLDEYDISRPTAEVAYKNLTVTTQALVGGASVPNAFSPLVWLFKHLLFLHDQKEQRPIMLLDNVSGVLKPGRMTLLLGPPATGKSTLMKALAGRLVQNNIMKIEGDIYFNGTSTDEFHQRKSSVYVAQLDNHEPNLTVTETLDFAWACQNGMGTAKFSMPQEMYRKKLEAKHSTQLIDQLEAGNGPGCSSGDGQEASSSTSSSGGNKTMPVAWVTNTLFEHNGNGNGNGSANGSGLAKLKAASRAESYGMNDFEEVVAEDLVQGNRRRSCVWEFDRQAAGFSKYASTNTLKQPVTNGYLQTWGTIVKVDVVEKLLGLYHCKDTLVGNAIFRGISGGEKKRLTIGEQILGPQNVMMLDEISTGLDSATLYTVIKWFSKLCHSLHKTMLISLLQPPPEVFQLFDDVLILTEGKVLYHGPVEDAVPFFSSLGLVCPNRKDVPSFLLEVTTPAGQLLYANQQLRAAKGLPLEGDILKNSKCSNKQMIIPLTDICQAFWKTNRHGTAMAQELEQAPITKSNHPAALDRSPGYPLSWWESVLVASKRQAKLVLRDRVLLRGRVFQVIVLSLIIGSLFYRLPVDLTGARSFFGFCFLLVSMLIYGAFPQLVITLEAKKVWFKHRDNRFMPAAAQGVAMALAQIPLSLIETVIFSLVLYFMVGLYQSAGQFWCFFLVIFCNSLTFSAAYRFIACLMPDLITGNAMAGIFALLSVVTSGFAILRQNMPPWIIWCYWISPYAWGLRAFAVNEMLTPKWQNLPYPDNPSKTLGTGALESFGFYPSRGWIWADVGFQLGAYLFLTFCSILCLWKIVPQTPRAFLPNEEVVAKARADAQAHRQHLAAMRQAAQPTRPDNRKELAPAAPTDCEAKPSKRGLGTVAVATDVDIASSLQFQPITLVFKDVRYSVPNPNYSSKAAKSKPQSADIKASTANDDQIQHSAGGSSRPEKALASQTTKAADTASQETLQLLQGITGYSEPGVLTALMGGSGAGKTTLMDVLAGRKTVGTITGDIFVNGHPKDQRTWSRVVGYCEQMDIHTPLATVREALLFSARLRLPPTVSDEQAQAFVDEVLDIVDLIDIQFALVGSPGVSGLSVEQRKRLTIAVELVANPSVLFLDEPTSGLDARAAAIVMQAVRNLARNGRTVMVTIHQPSIEIFESFDTLLLIQRGGRTTFFGPLGERSSGLIDYLMAVPGTPALPPNYNPATWMLEVTGGSMATTVQELIGIVLGMVLQAVNVDWPTIYAGSQLAADARTHADSLVTLAQAENLPALTMSSYYAMPFKTQIIMLLKKFWLVYWRNPGYNLGRLFSVFYSSWIYAAVYWGQGKIPNDADIGTVQAVVGVLYSTINWLGIANCITAMPLVGYERVVFYRERAATMYNPFAYGIAISLVELPWLLLQTVLYMPTTYWTLQFEPDAGKFFYFFLMFLSNITFYNTLGQALTYITPSQGIAQVLAGSVNVLMTVFNGFTITYKDIPKGWKWANRINPNTWAIYGLVVSQLDSQNKHIQYDGSDLTIPAFMEKYYGYHKSLQWWCLLIMLAYIVFLRVLSVLAVRYFNFLKR